MKQEGRRRENKTALFKGVVWPGSDLTYHINAKQLLLRKYCARKCEK
jgi:hypothetical protein